MSTRTDTTIGAVRAHPLPRRNVFKDLLEREGSLGYILMAPALLLLAIFMAYPFIHGIEFALRSDKIGTPGEFVGLANFIRLAGQDGIFRQTVGNTFYYTFWATIFKVLLGLILALLMNQVFPFRNIVRAGLLLPYIIPTALSTLAWKWILDSTYGIISWTIKGISWWGLAFLPLLGYATIGDLGRDIFGWNMRLNIPFLGQTGLAMNSLISVNVWRGVPFYAIGLLAGLQTIPQELYEAAAIDGANAWQRFRHVTLPLIMPVLTIIVLFSVIQTFADFQLIYVLTGGGPANSTHVFATYAYQIGMMAGELSLGAAISLFMFPVMLVFTIAVLWYQRREQA
jgi:multiple sugar transport system permease protein